MGIEEIARTGKIAKAVDKSFAESEKYHLIEDVLKCTGMLVTLGIGYLAADRKHEDNIPGIVYG